MDSLAYFEEISADLDNPEVRACKKTGKRVVGTVCTNIPEEVIHAAGLLPFRLRAPGLPDTSRADAHLHRINCSYSRSLLELLLSGKLGFLDGLMVTDTCDHHLRLADALQARSSFPVHRFHMYRTRGSGARQWFVMEMKRMAQHLAEAHGAKVTEESLRRSFAVYNRTRELMERLDQSRKVHPPALTGSQYMKIVLTGLSIPREQFNERLHSLVAGLEAGDSRTRERSRLLVIGGACDSPGFIDFIEEQGACVVADNLCFGLRHYSGLIDENAPDPWEALAERYFDRVSCPSVMDGFDHGYAVLKKMIADYQIQGVVSARLKFCDHFAGARKMLTDALKEDGGIPVLELEREYNTAGSGQISTRLQAFLEMLDA